MDINLFLDTCATATVIRNPNLLINIQKLERPIPVNGVSPVPVFATAKGILPNFNIVAYLVQDSPKNLISYKNLTEKFYIDYSNEKSFFKATSKANSEIFYNFYSDHCGDGMFFCSSNSDKTIHAFNLSIQNSLLHSNQMNAKELKNIYLIRSIHLAFSHPNWDAMRKLLFSQNFQDFNLTAKDLSNYQLAFPYCKGCLSKVVNSNESNEHIKAEKFFQHVTMDIFYFNKFSKDYYLVLSDELSNFCFVKHMKNKNSNSIWSGIEEFLAQIKSYEVSYKPECIYSDNEPSVLKLKKQLNSIGIRLETSAPNGHINHIERQIRTIETKVLSTINELSFSLPGSLWKYAVDWVVTSMNMTPNVKTGDISPLKLVYGSDYASKINIIHQFGQFVSVKRPYLKNKIDKRYEVGILLARNMSTMNKVLIFSPVNGSIYWRKFLKNIPMSNFNVKNLNTVLSTYKDINGHDCKVDTLNWSSNSLLDNMGDSESEDILSNNLAPSINNYHLTDAANCGVNINAPALPGVNDADSDIDFDYESDYLSGDDEFSDEENEYKNHELDQINNNNNDIDLNNYSNDTSDSDDDEDTWPVDRILFRRRDHSKIGRPYQYFVKYSGFDNPEFVYKGQLLNFTDQELANVPSEEQYNLNLHAEVESDAEQDNDNFNSALSDNDTISDLSEIEANYSQVMDYNVLNENLPLEINCFHTTFKTSMESNAIQTEQAIMKEFNALKDMEVYEFVCPNDVTSDIRSKLIIGFPIMKEKRNAANEFVKFKARFCCNGKQQKNIDKNLWTYAPTVSMSVVKLLLGISCVQKRLVSTIDISVAFLNAPLEQDTYVKVPKYLVDILLKYNYNYYSKWVLEDGSLIWKLNRSLYGLSNSPYNWNKCLSEALIEFGFVRSASETSLFVKNIDGTNRKFFITTYVDDILCSYETESDLQQFKQFLISKFKNISFNETNNVFDYLGIGIAYDFENSTMILHQQGYINQLLNKFNIKGYSKIPFDGNLFTENDEIISQDKICFDCKAGDSKLFLSILMGISFCLVTRPELAVGISVLSSRAQNPSISDFKRLEKCLKYLNLTKHNVMTLKPDALQLVAYVDASYLTHVDSKSHMGCCISLGPMENGAGCLLYTKSKKSPIVCKSSCEAELVSIDSCLSELIFLRKCCSDLGINVGKIIIFNDNLSTLKICNNDSVMFKAAKHISMRFYFIREKIKEGIVELNYKNTHKLVSDLLTKPLANPKFQNFTQILLCTPKNWEFYHVDDTKS